MKLLKNKFNSMLLCMMLIVAMAFTTAGCAKDEAPKNDISTESEKSSQNDIDTESEKSSQNDIDTESGTENEDADKADSTSSDDVTVLGEGSVKFTFEVVDGEGNQKNFEIHTDKESVADALLEFDLIAGDDSEYGLYVKTVNGITADYDVDGTYWAFYIDGQYATSGVDGVVPQEGHTYSLKVEK